MRFLNVKTNRVVTIQTMPNTALGWSNGNSRNGHLLGSSVGKRYNFCEPQSYFTIDGKSVKVKALVVAGEL